MNRRSIRVKLAGWYLGVLFASLVLLDTGIWAALHHELYRSLDKSLSAGISGLSQFLERESDGDDLSSVLNEAREYTSGLPPGDRLRLVGADGSVVLDFPKSTASGA